MVVIDVVGHLGAPHHFQKCTPLNGGAFNMVRPIGTRKKTRPLKNSEFASAQYRATLIKHNASLRSIKKRLSSEESFRSAVFALCNSP